MPLTLLNDVIFLNSSYDCFLFVQRFLSLETVRLECFQQLTSKNESNALLSEKLSVNEEKQIEVVSMTRERHTHPF